jgi:hypothetical protein
VQPRRIRLEHAADFIANAPEDFHLLSLQARRVRWIIEAPVMAVHLTRKQRAHLIRLAANRDDRVDRLIEEFIQVLRAVRRNINPDLRQRLDGERMDVARRFAAGARHVDQITCRLAQNPFRGVRKPGSIGLPLPNLELTIQDDNGKQLGPNETGELCVRGGNVMLGYWNKPEETAKAMRGDWLLTGDIGHRDAENYFYITDRKKDMLLVNGINVYPREVEEVLYQYPGVKEAAVIGIPDARKGELPVAYIAPADGVTLDEKALHQFLREKLADYKVPKQINFVSALPRNATGKILKTELRKIAAA